MNVLLLREVVAVLLAGGAGERLYPLTRDRAKPAVFFGGPYRIIDFTLSNCINSGLRRIFIATQYKAQSLNRHVRMGWSSSLGNDLGEFVEILPPQKRVGENWYLGTADAVYQNLYSIERERPRFVIVLSGDHIYKMDYGKMLDVHVARGASLTMAAIEVPVSEARRFGVLEVDEDRWVTAFKEKPEQAAPTPWNPGYCLGSMGIYIFDFDFLVRELHRDAEQNTSHDFGRDIIPRLVAAGERVYTYLFWDENKKESKYWRDVGTIDAYFEATMDLVQVDPVFNVYDPEWPLRTHQPQLPPAKFVFADDGRMGNATESIVSSGCIVSGSHIRRSVLCPGVRVHSYCDVEDTILMPNATVNRHSRIRRAIIDRNMEVPRGAIIGYDAAEDRRRHSVSDGGVVVVTTGEECLVDAAFR
jgi:glucose-1-phosphate adenylyltransferase